MSDMVMVMHRKVDAYELATKELGLKETDPYRGGKHLSFEATGNAKALAAAIYECDIAYDIMMQLFRKWTEENGYKWEDQGKPADEKGKT